ncbi:type II toxin-antitoxin system Phd/YefM family antitoxin [Granulicella sp. S156]|jgi:antitoxin Phd|uniref:type II toxin-antitoxin system Phd/YefM family antitoxin n=1 Tax=Granulicella sp. S156 TaxID=1747224 RepID=UPI00131CB06C|nr:type II toxin-antitoxin system Phd/YefM family antitoxin [Granulicella sp. S156]
MATWQLQEAKAKLSEVIDIAQKKGPQIITQRGVKTAVIHSFEEWEQSQQSKKPTLLEILQSGPQGDLPIPPRGSWKMRKPVKF